jgi:hypothetical protein
VSARAATVAAAFALAACSGGVDPAPRPTAPHPTASPSASPVPTRDPGVAAIRAAVDRTLAACPCSVVVSVGGVNARPGAPAFNLHGVYDAAARTALLQRTVVGVPSGEVRVVDGRVFADPPHGGWVEIDASGMPARPIRGFAPLAFADPVIGFAAARGASLTANPSRTGSYESYDVAYDMTAVAAAAGPWGPMLLRAGNAVYGEVGIANGVLDHVAFSTPFTDTADSFFVNVRVEATGAKAPEVTAPAPVERTVVVARDDATW